MTNTTGVDSHRLALDAALSRDAYAATLSRLEDEARDTAARLHLDWSALMEHAPDEHSVARQALTIVRWGLFDAAWYGSTYADVQAAGLDPLVHYVSMGDAEGRRPNPFFDPNFYRSHFKTSPLGSVSALYHYAVLGETLGLKAANSFSPRRYLVSNDGLQGWVDRPLTHFLQLGRAAGLMVNHRSRLPASDKIEFARRVTTMRPDKVDLAAGINVIGPLDRVSGLGVSARGYLEGLRRAGFEKLGCRVQQREFAIQTGIARPPVLPPYLDDAGINLVHMNGDTLPVMIDAHGEDFLRARYNVAIWYWELPTLRPEWHVSMKYFDEFWAPTPFIARALQQSTAKPVRLVPPYLAYLESPPKRPTPDRPGSTRFVYCFDANSILERKNPGALLDAFQRAFPLSAGSDVRLTFKVTYPNRKLAAVERLYEAARNDARIEIVDRMLSDAEIHDLIATASAYVSPHRSEGLGLTVIEAMGAETPVISTPFGGVDLFVTDETAFPIAASAQELEADYPPYPQGFVWSDPDVDSLASQLLLVHHGDAEPTRRAARARVRVLEYFCSSNLVETYRREIHRIAAIRAPFVEQSAPPRSLRTS